VNSPSIPRLPGEARFRGKMALSSERWLLLAVLAEILLFSIAAPEFFSWTNLFEILRFSVELGLLSVALTPILITGGIDLSVGSAVGLTAVAIGAAWRDFHWSIGSAVALGLLVGCACGALNALFIGGLRLPPLIVTLGTYTLFRGIAEGITHGTESYAGFPARYLFLGQGYLGRIVPVQLPIFLAIAIGYWVLLHRSVIGRGLYAIGLNEAGARYAGILVRRHLVLLYLLSGVVSGIAGVILVAHLGLAKSDLGTGYELEAITAVVLGGTSVFGGRGTLFGSVLGLFFLSILQNGMHLLAMPSEFTGVLTGALLLVIVSLDQIQAGGRRGQMIGARIGRFSGSRTAIAAVVILVFLGAAGYAFVSHSRRTPGANQASAYASQGRRYVIAVMPKAKGDPYFKSVGDGAKEAARELGVDLIWDGPTNLDPSQQNEIVENWITMRVDAIVAAVANTGSLSTVLRKARRQGIPVITWDSDAAADARDFFLNQATPEGIAETLVDEAERRLPRGGQFAIITGPLSAENQNVWIQCIRDELARRHSRLTLAIVRPSDDDRDKAFLETQTILKMLPDVKLVMAISAPAVPGSAEAVAQSGRRDVDVIGLSLPSVCRPYIHAGTVQSIVLWSTRDMGYLTVYAGLLDAQHRIAPGSTSIEAGRLGKLQVRGSEIILGKPLVIDKSNIDHLDF